VTRTATPDDFGAVLALFARWAAEVDESPLTGTMLESEWSTPGFDPLCDHWLVERDGDVVGYVALKVGGGLAARGDVAGLLPLAESRARERGDDHLETITTTRDERLVQTLEAAGWARPRDVHRMWLALDAEPPEPRLPDGVTVRTYSPDDARPLHAFLELAYAQNNERVDPFEAWLHFMTAEPDFDGRFWHLAVADGGLVACALTWAPYEGNGWVKDLAVHPEHRRRGLGEALLHHAHRAYREAGVARVGLKVDSDNPTGAGRLYDRLGYATDRVYAIFTRSLRNP
jgi:ribosomal protein S18 acetylase RimI-like enzyme